MRRPFHSSAVIQEQSQLLRPALGRGCNKISYKGSWRRKHQMHRLENYTCVHIMKQIYF